MTLSMQAVMIGELAKRALTEDTAGKVMGVTSKGMFLAAGERILFVTEADYKSPFNIQVPGYSDMINRLSPGDAWRFESDGLILSDRSIRIDISSTEIWRPMPPAAVLCTQQEQRVRLEDLLRRMAEVDPAKGWLYLAVPHAGEDFPAGSEESRINQMTSDFLRCVREGDLEGACANARSIMGRGGGLTPSGDDWLSGFLLYHARSGKNDIFMQKLGQTLTAMAFERTTKISANRIEAACQGWSEQLFLEVIDTLFDPQRAFTDLQVKYLVGFGHSSGVDTCVGIWAAINNPGLK